MAKTPTKSCFCGYAIGDFSVCPECGRDLASIKAAWLERKEHARQLGSSLMFFCGYQIAQAIMYEATRYGYMLDTPVRVSAWLAVAWSIGGCVLWSSIRTRLSCKRRDYTLLAYAAISLPLFWADLFVFVRALG